MGDSILKINIKGKKVCNKIFYIKSQFLLRTFSETPCTYLIQYNNFFANTFFGPPLLSKFGLCNNVAFLNLFLKI